MACIDQTDPSMGAVRATWSQHGTHSDWEVVGFAVQASVKSAGMLRPRWRKLDRLWILRPSTDRLGAPGSVSSCCWNFSMLANKCWALGWSPGRRYMLLTREVVKVLQVQ